MKRSLFTLMTLVIAISLAFMTFAAPGVVGTPDTADGNYEGLDSATLMEENTLDSAPESVITAKELMSVAVRLHSELNGGGLSKEYNLDTYYQYALNNGIFADGVYTSEGQIPTRAQVVVALYNAARGKIDLTAINEVLDMIDVALDAPYYAAASDFMKAGIITGYDEYGTLKPNNNVKRYELALMVDRLLNPAERVTKKYEVYTTGEHVYLMDDFLHDLGAHSMTPGASGWRIDYTGSEEIGTINNYANVLRDYASDDDMSTSRRIRTQTSGELVFETVYKVTAGNTVHFGFYDINGNEIAVTGWQNGKAYVGDKSAPSSVKLDDKKEPSRNPDVDNFNYRLAGLTRTRVVLNLDTKKYEVWMGNSYIGEAAVNGTNLASVKIYTGYEEATVVDIRNTHLYKNYKVNDVFRLENQGNAPVGYTVDGKVTVERLRSNADNTGEVNSMKMVTEAGKTTYAKRGFDKAHGKVIMEAYVLLDDGASATTVENNAYFTVKSGDVPVLKVETKDNKWYVGSTELNLTTKVSRTDKTNRFTSNVWQWIRIEADTNIKAGQTKQQALIKINGKEAGTVDFLAKVDGFDGLEVGVTGTTAGDVIYFDDIEVYETFVDYYNTDADPDNDYVPEPQPLATPYGTSGEEYILNMSVCNLWRNGSHYGWDWIRPYAELEPVIGYYDEGNPEAMDWEIKYLTEHGIKNYMTCWYPHSGGKAIKKPRMVDAIHDGYFNAKYSDKMTFSLMFENSGYISNAQREDFVNNVFPFWMDWYFSDPRYFRIEEDGKKYIFLTIYQYLYFLDMACTSYDLLEYNENGDLYLKEQYQPSGNTVNSTVQAACNDAKALIAWMGEEIYKAGYADGIIAVFGGSTQSNAAYKTMALMNEPSTYVGGEGIILYAWGRTAWDVEAQKTLATSHTANAKAQGTDLLTLATPGFNDIGWTSLRPGYMKTEDFKTLLEDFHKPKMESNFGTNSDSWKKKLITFDTWNEYGEGHYLFPTAGEYKGEGYGGFGYLDAIAEVFGGTNYDANMHTDTELDIAPTPIQKARVGSMYPGDNDHYIRRDMLATTETPSTYKVLGGRDFTQNVTANDTALGRSPSNFTDLLTGVSSWLRDDFFMYDSTRKCWYGKSSSKCDTANPARINFDGDSAFKNINMDEVSYIRLKLGTSTGGSTGKIYFKNTTDTSQYSNYNEERTFRFNTYVDGKAECNYLFNVKDNKLFTGTLAGIMLECTNEPNETVYLYDLEFITEDESTRKTTIYVDNQLYKTKDYGEIRSEPTSEKGEIYITPTEDGGLYKLLHIAYNWNRSAVTNEITGTVETPAYVLKLDTPDGTTFEFNYNNKQIKKNGTVVGTDNNLEIYDGAPTIPLLYVLDNAGYFYSYNFTDRILNITVANTFEMDDQIENGDAESTDPELDDEFYPGSDKYTITVETDPDDSTNKVWMLNPANEKSWSYIRTDFEWEAGKTYTIDFDARRTGKLGDGSTLLGTSSTLVFNARYADTAGTNGVEHNPDETKVTITDEWQHFTIQYTVAETLDTTSTFAPQLTFYVNPYENRIGEGYMMDNIVVREQPIAFKLTNGDAEGSAIGKDQGSFFSGHENNPLTIETESNGNKYWKLTNTNVGNDNYAYIRQETTFEKGVTYYYTVRAKIGQNAAGENVPSARITLNPRYYDAAKLGSTGEWYAHSYDLRNKAGEIVYFATGGDWVTCYGSFTVSHGYDHDKHGTSALEEITFFAGPYNTSGVTMMIDDFKVTTDPDVYAGW